MTPGQPPDRVFGAVIWSACRARNGNGGTDTE
jgi:hypothetical protein